VNLLLIHNIKYIKYYNQSKIHLINFFYIGRFICYDWRCETSPIITDESPNIKKIETLIYNNIFYIIIIIHNND